MGYTDLGRLEEQTEHQDNLKKATAGSKSHSGKRLRLAEPIDLIGGAL